MRAFNRLRLWNRVRVAINQAMRDSDPAAVERLLREEPAASSKVARRVRSMSEVYPVHALRLAVGLARCEAPETLDLLDWLADREFGWDRLEEVAVRDLRRYLVDHGEMELLDAVRGQLEDRQLAWVLPDLGADDFVAELERLPGGRALGSAVQSITGFIESVKLHGQPAGRGLANAGLAAATLWNRGHMEEALQVWTVVVIAEPRIVADHPEWMRAVATALPDWIPSPEPLSLDGLAVTVQMVTPVPPRIVRAADLLADFPRAEWIESLRRAWLAVDDLVRRDSGAEHLERDPLRLMTAQSIASALGACAAFDRQMRALVPDEPGRKKRHEDLRRQVELRSQLVDKHNKLVDEHHDGKDVVDAIRKMKDKIGQQDAMIARTRASLREELTPAALLHQTISDGQSYPLEVRQGAAWGLHRIVEDGALEGESLDRVRETLRTVLHGQELDESALRGRIAAHLPEGDQRVRDLLVAGERYAADHDAEELDVAVRRLAPEIPSFAKEIRDGVDVSRRSRARGELGERVLRVLPGASLLELVGALRRGLRWMVELVEGRAGGDPALEENLPLIAALIGEQLPDAVGFLSRYPLHLMTLHRHRQILGQYTRDKVQLQFWTRYTPPRWFRGADPRELGQVHRRYLDLDDRSAPNSMGLYYRLFEHPVLVVPVLYHEFMHYGGPAGDPKRGIENETEVLFREVLFARHLLTRLAPANDADLSAYETALANAIERTELLGLGQQLFHELEEEDFLEKINDQIEEIYGKARGDAEASAEVDRKIERWNRTVALENQTDEAKRSWCPEIDWPELGIPATRALTDRLRTVLSHVLRQNHRLAAERCDTVLSEPVCQSHRDDWSAYRKRAGACVELARRFAPGGLDPNALQVLVQRFEVDHPDVAMGGLLRLLESLGLPGLVEGS